MIFSWWKGWRRQRIRSKPFPETWDGYLHRNQPFYETLFPEEKHELCNRIKVFVREKHWEGCGGLEITDEIKVTIAAQACLLVLGFKNHVFDRVESILVYPSEYFSVEEEVTEAGTVIQDLQGRLGEAWYRGPVILSWEDVRHGCSQPEDGINVVIHEFAHQLDMEDGLFDGTPPLRDREMVRRWQTVMTREHEKLVRRSERGRATLLDAYGASDPGEFFAVAVECFFEMPLAFRVRHPELYRLFEDYFHQDPVARIVGERNKPPKPSPD